MKAAGVVGPAVKPPSLPAVYLWRAKYESRGNLLFADMNERILCVDDEPCVLQACQRAMRKQFIIEGAFGGEEALQAIAQKGPYAVVVADMRMPGMNGIQLLVKVREICPIPFA